MASHYKEFLPFEDALAVARSLGLNSTREWEAWSKLFYPGSTNWQMLQTVARAVEMSRRVGVKVRRPPRPPAASALPTPPSSR